MDTPATYRIRLQGCPSRAWVEALWGSLIFNSGASEAPNQTIYIGEIIDQAALVGLINAFYNQGYAIITIQKVMPEEQPALG